MAPKIRFDHSRLEEICRTKHIRELALFGSVLRDDLEEHLQG